MPPDFILSEISVDAIVHAIHDDDFSRIGRPYCRFLGIGDLELHPVDRDGDLVDRMLIPAYQSRAAAAIGFPSVGRSLAVLNEIVQRPWITGGHAATMDVATAAWLETLGLSAADLYLLGSFSTEMRLERRDGSWVNDKSYVVFSSEGENDDPSLVVCCHFAEGCWWADGTLDIPESMTVPASAMAASIGRPLREVFSHAHLNSFPIQIVEWNEEDPTVIVTDAARVNVFPVSRP